ncbi:MAG TPA: DUF4348 domain-containing protein [Cyclobacteriaceae bacterium]|nr:DUF4348 domain-containing protein [Cyclobacteriaceae bacterium]HMV90343.1 DUF4348 domain-containing protein [Cyclobacteriaceae bacterium]HMX00546.1 DUF4348 domain-containing protein [Cyclobacteriaceae bacterium]HMY93349.1 DUF4348 domain-containing protein [Cyclobacteriaceae bacterium]HNA13987.1 DUF4348 domain-containing protein [Cyclobacteriaceae bacterium]
MEIDSTGMVESTATTDEIPRYTDRGERFEVKFLSTDDSVARYVSFLNEDVSIEEIQAHVRIWQIESVREIGIYVKKRAIELGQQIEVVTMLEEEPGEQSEFYVVAVYEFHDQSHLTRVATFRIVSNNLIEQYNAVQNVWGKYEENNDERFEIFFEKFKLDSVFQHVRVQFPFLDERVNLDNDSGPDEFITDSIEEDDWTFANFNYDESIAKRGLDAYTQEVKVEKDRAVIEIRGVDNGIWIDYYFERQNGKWVLISGKDSSN